MMEPNTTNPNTPAEPVPETTPIQPVTPLETPAPSPIKQGGGKKLFGKLGVVPAVIAAVVLLAAGSAAAYFGIIVPNKPENVLKASFEKTLQQKKAKFDGKFSFESTEPDAVIKAVNVGIKGQSNAETAAFQTELEVTASGVKLPIEVRKVEKSLFFKVGDLSTIKGLATAAAPEYGFIIDEVNKKLADQWIEVDETLLKQANADCALDTAFTLTQEDIELIQRRYQKVPFAAVKTTSSDTVNGRSAYKYEIEIDDNKGAEYFKGLEELSMVKKLKECTDEYEPLDAEEMADGDITPLTIWVDKGTKTLSKIASHTTPQDEEKNKMKGSFEMIFQFGEANITKPEGAKPAMEVFSELQALFTSQFTTGTGLDLQSLEAEGAGSFDF